MIIEKKNRFVEEEINTIINGLNSYNRSQIERDYSPFMIIIKEKGEIIGGAQCASVWDWMHVKILWIGEKQSRNGLGTRLMSEIETEAEIRGCIGVHLDTFEFQALGFYRKLGYKIFGEIEDHPKGKSRYFLKKRLG